jgi:hypothetical protein
MPEPYRVLWRQSLTPQLAQFTQAFIRQGRDAAAILEAVDRISRRLSDSPDEQGESRGPYERVVIEPPLAAYYEVFADEQIVFVVRVHCATYGPES